MNIAKDTTLEQLAVIVCTHLKKHNIDAILTGGACVSIYSKNEYQSLDLDFITYAREKQLVKVLEEIGFRKEKSRYFTHPVTPFFVEFPSPPLAIGKKPITSWATKRIKDNILTLLMPTHCVMDRLAAFYHWNDYESLQQALMVARQQKIDLHEIKKWSVDEGMYAQYTVFEKKLKELIK